VLFQDLELHAELLDAARNEGYVTPTPIQQKAIPHVLDGRDVLGCAQTGTGKTAAFALPILDHLMRNPLPGGTPRVLVLVPTRELATQVGESFQRYAGRSKIRTTVVIGGVDIKRDVRALDAGTEVLVAAPGRLIDLMERGDVSLKDVEVVVLDEADRMLDMGFIQPIRKIIAALPRDRQSLMFSATMPEDIRKLAASFLYDPVSVSVTPVASTAERVEQRVMFVEQPRKLEMLARVLEQDPVERVLVFTRTKHGADRVARKLRPHGVEASVIHGNKSQNQRQRALATFKDGRGRQVLIATDVAARGIDVDGVTHVVNYDLPNEPESYVHRIGRTGRAGAGGIAISFCDQSEREYLRDIERVIRKRLQVSTDAQAAVS
jgi:ATP-dependent RNA helicase RhlE